MIDPNLKKVRNLVWIDDEPISEVIKILMEEADGLKEPTLEINAYSDCGDCNVYVCGYVNKTEYELKKAVEEAKRAAKLLEERERAELERLKAKYETGG